MVNPMKRIASLLLALCLLAAVSLTACSQTDNPASDVSTASSTTSSGGETTAAGAADPTAAGTGPAGETAPAGQEPATPGQNTTRRPQQETTTTQSSGSGQSEKVYKTNDLAVSSEKGKVVNNCYTVNYPIAQNATTLSVMIKDYSGLTNYSAMKLNEFLKTKMNLTIDWILVSETAVAERIVLAYTSGNLPDIFMGMAPFGYSSHWNYIQQGMIQPLDDYIDQFAPNIKRLADENALFDYYSRAKDGKIYMIPMVNEERNPFIYESLFINKTWLDNLGLKMPTTTDELEKVLRAFKNNDPNGNGLNDEIPLLLSSANMTGLVPGCLFGPFGIAAYGGSVGTQIDENGKVVNNYTSDNYRDALIYYRDLYQDGLIDKEWFSNTEETVARKLQSSTVTVGAFVSENGTGLAGAQRMEDHYVTVPALTGPDGEKTWAITQREYIWPEWFLVTKACAYPEIAVRFADYFYSLEGTLTALLGPQGYNWDVDANGVISMTDAYYADKYKETDLTPGYPLPHYQSADYISLTKIPDGKMTQAQRMEEKEKEDRQAAYAGASPKYPEINYTVWDEDKTQSDEYSEYLNVYIHQLEREFLENTTNIEKFWDNYVGVCNSLGAKESQAILQESLDDYFDFLREHR